MTFLIPEGARAGMAWLPLTHYPVLDPSNPKWLDSTLESYDEAIASFRELVEVEGRTVFRWHLADTLRNAAGVLMQRGRHAKAEAAAREAIALYEPLLEGGDTRVVDGLSVAHSALSVLEARKKRHREAHAHADQALALLGRSIGDAYTMLQAYQLVLDAWEQERAGDERRSREKLRFAA